MTLAENWDERPGERETEVSFSLNGTPIKFKMRNIISDKQIVRNIMAALKTNFPALGPIINSTAKATQPPTL